MKDHDVIDALKSVTGRISLRIVYDGGKQREVKGGPSLDPKPKGTAQIIEESGLSKYATAVHVTGGHLMHSRYAIRDSDTVWTGSGNWTCDGLDLQDNNFLVLSSQQLADAYKTNFENPYFRIAQTPVQDQEARHGSLAFKIGNETVTPYFSGGGTEGDRKCGSDTNQQCQ